MAVVLFQLNVQFFIRMLISFVCFQFVIFKNLAFFTETKLYTKDSNNNLLLICGVTDTNYIKIMMVNTLFLYASHAN